MRQAFLGIRSVWVLHRFDFTFLHDAHVKIIDSSYVSAFLQVSTALSTLEGELKGTFYPLEGMDKDTQQMLIDEHFLFKEGDRFLQDANACRYWPSGTFHFFFLLQLCYSYLKILRSKPIQKSPNFFTV